MNPIAPGWARGALGELVALRTGPFGSALHKREYVHGQVPVINPSHIVDGRLVPDPSVSVDLEVAERLSDFRLNAGDVVIGRRGEMGRCAMVSPAEAGWLCGTGSLVLRSLGGVLPSFLQRFLSSPSVVSKLDHGSVGSTMVNLNQRLLRSLPCAVPPLAEQQRIADKLDTLLTRIDACRDRLDRVGPLLQRFRQSVLTTAFNGALTETWRQTHARPAWQAASLADLGVVSGGLTKNAKRDALPRRHRYLRVANVYLNRLELDDVAEIGATESEFEKTRLESGDLLIVEGNGSIDQVGRVAMWRGELQDCCHQNHLIRWRAGKGVLPEFVLYWLMSPAGRSALMERASSSSGLHTLSISKVSSIVVPCPSLDEQAEIVTQIDRLLRLATRLEARRTAADHQLQHVTPSALAKAFRGELVPQDPNDEPAEALLARIRSQREVAPAAGPRRRSPRSRP